MTQLPVPPLVPMTPVGDEPHPDPSPAVQAHMATKWCMDVWQGLLFLGVQPPPWAIAQLGIDTLILTVRPKFIVTDAVGGLARSEDLLKHEQDYYGGRTWVLRGTFPLDLQSFTDHEIARIRSLAAIVAEQMNAGLSVMIADSHVLDRAKLIATVALHRMTGLSGPNILTLIGNVLHEGWTFRNSADPRHDPTRTWIYSLAEQTCEHGPDADDACRWCHGRAYAAAEALRRS